MLILRLYVQTVA